MDDQIDACRRDTVEPSDLRLSRAACHIFPNLDHLTSRQLRVGVPITLQRSALSNTVLHVLLPSTLKHVPHVATRLVVTAMTDLFARSNCPALLQLERDYVSLPDLLSDSERAIAVLEPTCLPGPTLVRPTLLHLYPKSIHQKDTEEQGRRSWGIPNSTPRCGSLSRPHPWTRTRKTIYQRLLPTCWGDRHRTCNLRIQNPTLFRLSYTPTHRELVHRRIIWSEQESGNDPAFGSRIQLEEKDGLGERPPNCLSACYCSTRLSYRADFISGGIRTLDP